MYRSKKVTKKAAAAREAVLGDSENPEKQSLIHVPTVESEFAEKIMSLKNRIMSPFMFYDKALRRVVANPAHDRVLRAEISRIQGVVLRELRTVLERESFSTPKEMLYGIQRTVFFVYASCALQSGIEALMPIASDEETIDLLPRLERFFAERTACAKAIVSVATLLSTGIVKDTFVEACGRLEARIEAEELLSVHKKRSKEASDALSSTKKNATDFFQLRGAMETAFDSINSSFIEPGKPSLSNSVAVDMTTAVLVVESFYSLLGWVLMVQPDRLNLENARSSFSGVEARPAASEVCAKVTAYDPEAGKIRIERPTITSKWGLMLNSDGALVGIENALRNTTTEGGFLYRVLQQESSGLIIFDINQKRIRAQKDTDEDKGKESKTVRQGKILEALQIPGLSIELSVSKPQTILNQPQEVAFDIVPQGGEDASGQQVALIIKRPSIDVPWLLQMRRADETFVLDDVAEGVKLSDEARDFILEHRGNLLIININGCVTSAVTPDFLHDVIRSSTYLVMRLQVISGAEHMTESTKNNTSTMKKTETTAKTKKVEINQPEGDMGEGVTAAKIDAAQKDLTINADVRTVLASEKVDDNDDGEDAEVSRHRALLQANNINPDEPLPDVEKSGRLNKKHSHSQKHTVEEVDATNETTMRGSDEVVPENLSSGDTENTKKRQPKTAANMKVGNKASEKGGKSGRQKKITAQAEEKAPSPEDIPPPAAIENLPSKETDETELTAKKRGRPKKTAAQAEEKAPSPEDIPPPAAIENLPSKETDETELTAKTRGRPKKIAAQAEEKAAPAQEGMDTPLVKIKSRVELAKEVGKKIQSAKKEASNEAQTEKGTSEAEVDLAAVLEQAPPLTFENAVTLDRFDGVTMDLRRPDVKTPWDIKVSLTGDNLMLTRLPPISAALRTHPFVKRLHAQADGSIKWMVDSVNGTDLTKSNRAARSKALDAIKKANKVSFMLRQIR